MKTADITIIGAGLTGLTLAYLLKDFNLSVNIIEARQRNGGRIYTSYKNDSAPIEMGATWLGHQHTFLKQLLSDINLNIFEQDLGDKAIYEPTSLSPHQLVTLPPHQEPSFRIVGGTSKLIERLSALIPNSNIYNNEIVTAITDHGNNINIATHKSTYQSKMVVSTLPPYLLQSTIKVEPALPESIQNIMESTHTWMGESIKVGLRFKRPFWKTQNSSGTIFSNVGPIPEFYDHSNYENSHFALKGFLNNSYYSLRKDERLNLILDQLRKYYGNAIDDYIAYEESIWRLEKFTYANYHNHVLPHQNNGHELYKKTFLNHKLHIAGAETATEFPGYMEGAVRSAYRVFQKLNI